MMPPIVPHIPESLRQVVELAQGWSHAELK